MRIKLLALIIGLFFFSAEAQTFKFSSKMHYDTAFTQASFQVYEFYFAPQSPENITFAWKRVENSLPENWSYSLCDYGSCYVGFPSSGKMSTMSAAEIEAGEEAFMKFNLSPKSLGKGEVKIYIYDYNNVSRGDTVTIKINYADVLTVSTFQSANLNIYPNPTNGILNLDNLTLNNGKATVLSNIGSTVKSFDLINGSNQVDISDLAKGVYFLRIEDQSGLVKTSKILLQ